LATPARGFKHYMGSYQDASK